MMHTRTLRETIRNVPFRWREQYYRAGQWRYDSENERIYNELVKLDLETATPADIAAIIGNFSWTDLKCYNCDTTAEKVVYLMGVAHDEYGDPAYCTACIDAAQAALASCTTRPK